MEGRRNGACVPMRDPVWAQDRSQCIYTRGDKILNRKWDDVAFTSHASGHPALSLPGGLRAPSLHYLPSARNLVQAEPSQSTDGRARKDSPLIFSDAKVGAGYSLLGISTTGPVPVGSPSLSHLGRPPSSTLDLSCPKVRNMNSARGAEKMP
jgi:hypothetical protein